MGDLPDIAAQAKEFFYFIGMAITDWAKIDEQLFQICVTALKTEGHIAAIVYYRNMTLSGRLSLVSELVGATFPPRKPGSQPSRLEKTWDDLRREIEELMPVRNQLAHSPADPQTQISPNQNPNRPPVITDIWWASYISGTEKMRGKKSNPDLKLQDVKDHLKKLVAIFLRLRDFNGALSKLPR